jgi:hypothetical protein
MVIFFIDMSMAWLSNAINVVIGLILRASAMEEPVTLGQMPSLSVICVICRTIFPRQGSQNESKDLNCLYWCSS